MSLEPGSTTTSGHPSPSKVTRQPLPYGFTMAWLPAGAELVHVGELWGQPYLWVRADPTQRQVGRSLYTTRDDEDVPPDVVHVETLIQLSGAVLHVWDGGEH